MHKLYSIIRYFYRLIIFSIQFILYLIFWLLIPIVNIFWPKKNIWLFIGRDNGRFIDNIKAVFLFLHNNSNSYKEIDYYFITQDKNVFIELMKNNLPCLYYPTVKTIIKMLSAKVVFVDNYMWFRYLKFFFTYSAKKIQIWHGIGIKKIFLADKKSFPTFIHYIAGKLSGNIINFDYLISTSEFFSKYFFSKSFKYKKIIETGYPRNDILFKNNNDNIGSEHLLFSDLNIIKNVIAFKKDKYKIICYTPTFRDTGGDFLSDKIIDLNELNNFLKFHKMIFIVKFHPDPNFEYNYINNLDNILFYKNEYDIYPLLIYTDLLITDYSSLYFDFLLLDKPIILFPYDYNKYVTKDRELFFDYNFIMPGERAYNFEELIKVIKLILIEDKDFYLDKRIEIKKLAFKHNDNLSSKRIIDLIYYNLIK